MLKVRFVCSHNCNNVIVCIHCDDNVQRLLTLPAEEESAWKGSVFGVIFNQLA